MTENNTFVKYALHFRYHTTILDTFLMSVQILALNGIILNYKNIFLYQILYLYLRITLYNMNKKLIAFRIEPELDKQVQRFAEEHFVTKSEVYRTIIRSYFKNWIKKIFK